MGDFEKIIMVAVGAGVGYAAYKHRRGLLKFLEFLAEENRMLNKNKQPLVK